jgi:hypothetical protein
MESGRGQGVAMYKPNHDGNKRTLDDGNKRILLPALVLQCGYGYD